MRTKPIPLEVSLTGVEYMQNILIMRFEEAHQIKVIQERQNTLTDTILKAFQDGKKIKFKGTYHSRTHPIIHFLGTLVSLPYSNPFDCREHFYDGTISTDEVSYPISNSYGLRGPRFRIST